MKVSVHNATPEEASLSIDMGFGSELEVSVQAARGGYRELSVSWESPAQVIGPRDQVRDHSSREVLSTTLDVQGGSSYLDEDLTDGELQALLWAVRNLSLESLRDGPYSRQRIAITGERVGSELAHATNKVERRLGSRINQRRVEQRS